MILNKLTIHNIASIEDAEIDFKAEPISSASIFLICGTTGSGKSTILDCIALSLYGTSPRLQSSPQKSSADNEDVKLSDERQYLRRGSKEGYSILEFTGNDKTNYTAKIFFRYKKTEKIDSTKRILEYDNTILDKKGEIDKRIKDAIGIDYSQFCRTTLLAQGEFTKFLKSNDADKSSILEKITGTEIYSVIGKKIFEKNKYNEEIFKSESMKLENIKTLSNEEKDNYNSQINNLNAELKENEEKLTDCRNIKQWFDSKDDIENDINRNCDRLKISLSKKDDIYYNRQKFISDYEKHSKIIDTYGNFVKHKKEITEYQGTRDVFYRRYKELFCNLSHYENILKQKQAKEATLKLKYDSIKDKTELYEQASTIYSYIDRIINYKNEIAKQEKEILLLSEKLRQEEPSKNEIVKSIDELTSKINDRNKEAQEILQKLEALDFNKISTELSNIKEQQIRFNEALSIIKEIDDTEKKNLTNRETIENLKNDLSREESKNKKEEKAIADKKSCFENISRNKIIYNDTAKQIALLRTNLSKGDICPVCGNIVKDMPSEENINKLADDIKREYENAKQELDLLEKTHTSTVLQINNLQKEIIHLESGIKELDEKKAALYSQLNTILSSVGLDHNKKKEEISDSINNLLIYNGNTIKALTQQQELYNKYNDDYKITITRKDESTNNLANKKSELEQITHNIIAIENNIASIKAINKTKENDLHKEFELLQSTPLFNYYNKEDDLSFIRQDLQQKQNSYKELVNEINDIEAAIESDSKAISEAKNISDKITCQFKDNDIDISPNEYKSTVTLSQQEIIAELNSIYDDIVKNSGYISKTENAIKESDTLLHSYLNQHNVDIDYIKEMYNTSEETLLKYKNHIESVDNEIHQITAILKDRKESLLKHLSLQNEEIQKSSVDEYIAKIKEYEDIKNKNIARITELNTILGNDRHNIEQYNRQKEILEKSKCQYDISNRLEKAFGDSDGKKFRMIAQSYILKELLSKSNEYLAKISDRYRLSCQTNTLNIEVSDDYMGGRTRPVNMMSGGESFIISLSLALGLSNLNNRLRSSNILFIDEGFGTLDSNTLENVMNTLIRLHEIGGQKIGIISHVETLRERIPTKIELTQKGSHSVINIYRNGPQQ